MDSENVIKALSALAQPLRLQVFRALVVAGDAGLTPGTMAQALGVPQNSLSFHLKELAHAGLVTQERLSRHIVYRAAYQTMGALMAYLTENCCQGQACAPATAPGCAPATAQGCAPATSPSCAPTTGSSPQRAH